MSETIIKVERLNSKEISINAEFDKDANVIDLITALNQLHDQLCNKINSYTKQGGKSETATIKDLTT